MAFGVGMLSGAWASLGAGSGAWALPGMVASGALLAPVGLVVGSLLGAATTLLRRLPPSLATRAGAPAGPFQAAFLLVSALLGAVAVGILWLTARKALTLDATDLAVATVVFAAAVVGVAVVGGALPLAALLSAALARGGGDGAWNPARVGAAARWGAAVVVVGAGAWFVARHGPLLGDAALIVHALMIGAAMLPWTFGRGAPGRRARVGLGAAAGVVAVLFVASAPGLSAWSQAHRIVSASTGASTMARWLRRATDVDGDGVSSLFGGQDCAPFDPDRTLRIPGPSGDLVCAGPDHFAGDDGAPQMPPISGLLGDDRARPYNVVLIVVDALRADRLGMAGYERALTTEIDRFAQEGQTFSNAWSQSSATRISFASFLSGKLPTRLQWRKVGRRHVPDDDEPLLQERLAEHGYRTGFVATQWFQQHLPALLRGFDHFVDVWFDDDYRRWRKGSAPVTTARAVEFIAEQDDAPFFLTAYYEGPHGPYHDLSERNAPTFGDGEVDRYDQEVWYTDRHVGFLLDYLRSDPELWDDTIVLITADHGEEFGEHGHRHHGHNCHRATTHVPLIMRVPGMEPGVVDAPVGLVDMVPTVLEAVGEESDLSDVDGRSLFYPLLGPTDAERPVHCALFEDHNPRATFQQSVRVGELFLLAKPPGDDLVLYETGGPEGPGALHELHEEHPELPRLRQLLDSPASVRFGQ